MFFNVPTPERRERRREDADASNPLTATLRAIGGIGSAVAGGVSSAVDLTNALVNTQIRRDGEFAISPGPRTAPHSILNARIGRNRRFATQQYEFDRLKALSSSTARRSTTSRWRSSVAVCAIPHRPRRAAGPLARRVRPVNVRPKGDEGGGNAVGAILAPMGTDIDDPVERLERSRRRRAASKAQLQTMSPRRSSPTARRCWHPQAGRSPEP